VGEEQEACKDCERRANLYQHIGQFVICPFCRTPSYNGIPFSEKNCGSLEYTKHETLIKNMISKKDRKER
jgi:hypothetical protein